MLVGIHQPNYLPGISYFCKILCSEVFVLLDSVQFSKGNWTNRNRIKSSQGELMLTVPLLLRGKGPQLISETVINNRIDWRKKHLQGIYQNYRKSSYFNEIFPIIEKCYDTHEESLSKLNSCLIQSICTYLSMDKKFVLSSSLSMESDLKSTSLLVRLCSEVGGTAYISGLGGKKYMEMDTFAQSGLNVSFLEYVGSAYQQRNGDFIPNLSIIDLLFNEGPNTIQVLKRSYRIVNE